MKMRLNEWLQVKETTMLLALVIWLCVTPLLLLLTVPFFGWGTGITALAAGLLVALLLCRRICLFPNRL